MVSRTVIAGKRLRRCAEAARGIARACMLAAVSLFLVTAASAQSEQIGPPQSTEPAHQIPESLRSKPQIKRPPLYQVILLNDDFTPMEFVVDVLEHIFGLDRTTATRVMLEVHTRGKGVCGVYTYEIAETKVAQVTTYARQHQHPLLCTMEEA